MDLDIWEAKVDSQFVFRQSVHTQAVVQANNKVEHCTFAPLFLAFSRVDGILRMVSSPSESHAKG